MKKGRFLWSAHRITERQKAGKARNIKGKQLKNSRSTRTAELIDEEVKRMINEQYDRAKAILSEHKDGHNELARLLVEKEVIFAEDVERIFGKRPWTSRSEEIMALEATAKPVEVTEDFEEKNSSDSEEKEKEKKEA